MTRFCFCRNKKHALSQTYQVSILEYKILKLLVTEFDIEATIFSFEKSTYYH